MPKALTIIFALLALACSKPEATVVKRVPVKVVTVEQRDVPVFAELVGQTIGSQDINIRARVDGTIEGIHFDEGKEVTKDQLLYTIDAQPFEAKVVEAEGKLAEAKTALTKANNDLKRVRPLAKIKAVSQRDLDAAVAAYESSKGSVKAAEAAVVLAKIELSYTQVTAPVAGVIGISTPKVGDFVSRQSSDSTLNTVSKIDPIHVRASIGETEYLRIARRFVNNHGNMDKAQEQDKKQRKAIELFLADGSQHTYPGKFHALNSRVDPSTGTVTIEISFPNTEKILRPGQFARIRFVEKTEKDAAVIPQRAIQELQGIFQVYIVDTEGKVAIRQVTPSTKVDGYTVIKEGLKPGETVIVEGLQQVRPGALVETSPWSKPDVKA